MKYHTNEYEVVIDGVYYSVPLKRQEEIKAYVKYGIKPGKFLEAVMLNNLKGAVKYAPDPLVVANLPAYVSYFENHAPASAWGSPEKVQAWAEVGGLEGYFGAWAKTDNERMAEAMKVFA